MEKKWQYALVALGGFLLCGTTTSVGTYLGNKKGYERGYEKGYNQGYEEGLEEGYNKSEPEIMFLNYKIHGLDGMCVVRNKNEMVCALDADDNGSIDTLVLDPNTLEIKEGSTYGEDDCDSKYLRNRQKEQQKQEQPKNPQKI